MLFSPILPLERESGVLDGDMPQLFRVHKEACALRKLSSRCKWVCHMRSQVQAGDDEDRVVVMHLSQC